MVINFNLSQNFQNYKKPTLHRQNFTGLHHALEKKVYNSAETIGEMASYFKRENGQVGNLPAEMISLIKKNSSSNTAGVSEAIKSVKAAFAEVADILSPMDIKSIENLKEIDYASIEKEIVSMLANAPKNEIENINYCGFVMKNLNPKSSSFTDAKIKAECKLTGVMRKVGVLPKNGRVEVESIGIGLYGSAYKVSFFDGNLNENIHSKVLKVYKDKDTSVEQIKASLNKTAGLFAYMKENNSIEKFFGVIDSNKNLSKKDKIILSTNLGTRQDALLSVYSDKSIDMMINIFVNKLKAKNTGLHGVLPESNAALYIKKHISKDMKNFDIVTPYFFDYNHKFGVYDMSDSNLPQPTRCIDFSKLNIKHCDLKQNPDNIVCGRIIDYGGIESL